LSRTDFRAAAARRLSEERDLSPAIVSLLSPEHTHRNKGVRIVPLDKIEPNPQNPRMAINQEALEELAASIREHGVLQPVLVRPLEDGRFELIAGERRWRAAREAGLEMVPALIRDDDAATRMQTALIENVAREDLNPVDEARACAALVEDLGLTKDWAARIIRHVGNYGEIYERNVGSESKLGIPRGLNSLWNAGGIQYAPPIR